MLVALWASLRFIPVCVESVTAEFEDIKEDFDV
jgi:hypothetical protein